MQNLASLVLDDKEAIEHSERHRRHGEEIESSDYLAVILQKDEPLLAGIPAPNHTTQISGHGSFHQGKAQLLQFGVNLGSAPVGIVLGQRPIKSLTSRVILDLPPRGRDRHRQ